MKPANNCGNPGSNLTCYHPAHRNWDTGAGNMALTIERRMGTRLGKWMTVKAAMALGLLFGLSLSQLCLAQDPLNDVHVQPPPPAPTAPIDGKTPDAKPGPKTTVPLEGKKALSARPNERLRVDVNLVL